MKILKKLILDFPLIVLVLVNGVFTSQIYADEATVQKTIEHVRDSIKTYKLENGLKVIMYKRGTAPVFSSVVSVHVGGVDEVPGKTGIAHLLEHMAFKGTKTLGTKNYQAEKILLEEEEELVRKLLDKTISKKELERLKQNRIDQARYSGGETIDKEYSLRGGVGINASTDKELTNYYVDLPLKSFDFWCWLESDRIMNPVFRQFYSERDVVLEEKRMRYEDSPEGALYEKILEASFKEHPYKNSVIGYKEDLLNATATDIRNFHEMYYVPQNIVVSIVGNVDYDREIKTINKYFGKIPKGDLKEKNFKKEPKQTEELRVSVVKDSSPNIEISYHKPVFPDPEDISITMMYETLVGNSQAPLYKKLVQEKKLAVSVGADEFPGFEYPNLIGFSIVPVEGVSYETLIKEFDDIVEEYKKNGTTQEQFDIIKKSLTRQYIDSFESNAGMAKLLATSELIYGDWTKQFEWLEMIDDVTPDDLKEMAKKYLVKEQRVIGTIERR